MMIKNVVRRKRGFSLVELLVAMAITGLLGGAVATAIIQMFDVNNQNTNAITAQRQVQQVGYYMSRDGQNAQLVVTGNNPAGTGFPAVFSWTDWDGDLYTVTYTLSAEGRVTRSEVITIGGVAGSPTPRVIAESINPSSTVTNFEYSGSPGLYTITVTASVAGKNPVSETRIYEIRQRTVS